MGIKLALHKLFVNNFICNFLIRSLGLETTIYHKKNPYITFQPDTKRSIQENAGYSNRPEINEVLERSKNDLQNTITELCPTNAAVLDVGCGPGMYLQTLKGKGFDLYATDLNDGMISLARKNTPEAHFICGDFMEISLAKKFNLIYCIGMLIYIPTSQVKRFVEKLSQALEKDGILYLNYPHAMSKLDLLYHDLTYIRYSPAYIEKIIEPYFTIIKHEHAFDGRKIVGYDKHPYKSLNPLTDRTYKNSYLLIAKKK